MKNIAITMLVAMTQALRVTDEYPCHIPHDPESKGFVREPLTDLTAELPTAWDWGNIDGVNFLTNIKNQHIPQYCGSCWAQAATTALSDRIKILRNAQWPDINLAPQVLISCEQTDDGCHGGNAYNAYEWIKSNYITDETCAIYQARGWDNGQGCSAMAMCRNCAPSSACVVPKSYYQYNVDQYGHVSGESAMMNEIYQRGPIACSMRADAAFDAYDGGIYYDQSGNVDTNHEVTIVGWGEQNGVKFWRVQNSWGSHWGEEGFFRIVRGINNLGMESSCYWATPVEDWTVKHITTQEEQDDPANDQTVYVMPQPEYSGQEEPLADGACRVEKAEFTNGERITSHTFTPVADLPEQVDWRSVDGRNYLSWNKNQHIPQYCGSCWAEGTTSALADRFNIMDNLENPTPVAINAQAIVNAYAGGSCNGGNPSKVYEYAFNHGIPGGSCMQYIAYNLQTADADIDMCRDCSPPPPAEGESGIENCYPVPHRKYYVNEYYSIKGADQMKSDLARYGPIGCGIHATDEFDAYKGGIYSQHLNFILINHEISVVGYGKTYTGEEYWIGRNSWGTYWGEAGFFRMQMYTDNLGIEKDCTAGVPTYNPNLNTTSSEYMQ